MTEKIWAALDEDNKVVELFHGERAQAECAEYADAFKLQMVFYEISAVSRRMLWKKEKENEQDSGTV